MKKDAQQILYCLQSPTIPHKIHLAAKCSSYSMTFNNFLTVCT